MDLDGAWRPPTDWPEDYPPLVGWERGENGRWQPPASAAVSTTPDADHTASRERGASAGDGAPLDHEHVTEDYLGVSTRAQLPIAEPEKRPPLEMSKYRGYPEVEQTQRSRVAILDRPEPKERSLQAERDIRAMLLVGGAIGVAVLLLIVALVLQSRAGAAEQEAVAPTDPVPPEVIFAAETEAVREQRRQAARLDAPVAALAQLEVLEVSNVDASIAFDESLWTASSEGCLDVSERVLVGRSTEPIVWADNLECVASDGRWVDLYLGIELTRTIDAEVQSLVPLSNVHASGGADWTPATRDRFLNDTDHPATLVILAADSGHNPRSAAPDVWRPSNEASWCGYAVDWVAVKARWELSITAAESAALAEMLATCDQPGSTGAHAVSMVIDPIAAPTIDRLAVE